MISQSRSGLEGERRPGARSLRRAQLHPPDVNVGPGGINVRMPQFRGPQVQGPQMGSLNAQAGQGMLGRRGGSGGGVD